MPVKPAPKWETGLREVAPNTYAYLQYDGSWGISNAGFLKGDGGLLIIDATMVASMALQFIGQIRRVTDLPFRHLINTHSHPDHTGGNRLFDGAEIISHRICREEMARATPRPEGAPLPPMMEAMRTPAMDRMFRDQASDPGRYIKLPAVTYEERMTLRYGDTEAELLYYGPAHTFGDTLVYFPQSKVLFAGDVAFFYSMPLAASGKIGSWLRVIDRVKDLDIDLIVPGHGPIGGKDELEDEREYFEFVMDETRRCFEQGMTPEQAADAIDLGPYAEWLDAERIKANVAVVYRELRGEIEERRMPGPPVRRVVTGHNSDARAVVAIDEVAQGERFTLIWTTEGTPVDNTDPADGGKRDVGITLKGGTVFRIGEIAAGGRSPMHRTNSVDYGIVLEGELDMELDRGETVHLKAGDVVVQRGTNHAWVNNGDRPCKMAWILIDADPVTIDGRTLEPTM